MMRWTALLLVWGLGCASRGPVPTLSPLLDGEDAAEAKKHAPDLFAAAERAHEEAIGASRAGDDEAAADHATRGRLLYAAARYEALRVEAEEERIAFERRARRADAARRRDDAARAEVEREAHRLLALQVAEEQAELAFQAAEEVETRGGRVRGPERDRMHREAAAVLRRRAELVLRAAEALGAPSDEVEAISGRLTQASSIPVPAEAVRAADRALREANALLGALRGARPGPTRGELVALLDEATKRQFPASLTERGVVLDVAGVFGSTANVPDPIRIARLADLLRAHPHGSVRIEARAQGTPAAERRAEARAKSVVDGLTKAGIDGARLAFGRTAEGGPERVELILPAYTGGAPTRDDHEPR